MFKEMLSLLPGHYKKKDKKNNNMKPDKLFNVSLKIGYETKLGIVKAEDMPAALDYLHKEYPNWTVDSIEETIRTIL